MATGMATPSSYRDQRRGPQTRPGGRPNNYGPRNQSSGMPRRNGASNYSPSRPGNQAAAGSEDPVPDEGFYANSRMVGSVSQAMGRLVQVQVVNGNVYEGILMAVSKEFCLKIEQARLISKSKGKVETDNTSNSLMFKKEDYVNFTVQDVDLRVETFVDGAISGANRVNGQSNDPPKALVKWKDDSTDPGFTLEESAPGANGWDAVEMFRENKKKFNVESTYQENMSSYTTPLPKFKSKEDELKWRRIAEDGAKMIEQSEGYKERLEAENNPTVDEETRFSSVVRDGEQKPSAADRYVPPNRRPPSDHNQRGAAAAPVVHTPQPLPQREQRERRERGDARQESRESNRGWERNPMPRNQQHSMQQQPPAHMPSHSSPSQHRDVPPERLNNGDWRQDPAQRNAYMSNRTVPPHHGVPQGAPPQRGPHHVPMHVPIQPPLGQQMPVPVQVHPTVPPHPVQRNPPPAPVTSAPPPVIPTSLNAAPQQNNGEKPETQGLSQQASSPQGAPPAVAIPGGEKKSPRGVFSSADMDKKHADLKHFKKNFKVQLPEEDRSQAERRPDHESEHVQPVQEVEETPSPVQAPPPATQAVPPVTQAPPTPSAPSSTSQGTTAALAPSQGPPPPVQSQGMATTTSTSTETTNTGNSSSLNPLAMEFKPRQQQTVVQVATPTPSATPPAQGLRQSPGMMATVAHHHAQQQQPQQHPAMLMHHNPYHFNQIMTQQPRMPIQAHHPQQGQAKSYAAPKRAVVSVDPAVAIAAQNATGQPLQLGQATIPTPSYVYHPVPTPSHQVIQQGAQSYQMRLVQSNMPSFSTDPNHVAAAASSNHNQHIFMQQPLPAHMPTGHLAQSMPQPAHLHQHQHQHQHQHHSHLSSHPLPPVSQTQGSHPHPHQHPHPSPSPVQHMGPGAPAPGGPQLNHHAQGAPPTSNTPQPQLAYGHQIAGMLPPQQAGHHNAMPAHSVAQGPTTPAGMQFMPHQMQQGVNFSQAGGTGTSGPAPAHMQTGGHMGQPQHVVVMPQPPPQAINQTQMNPPHSHNHHQPHAAAAAQFQQQIQGAPSQMHTAGVGPNQHLLQGNVSAANAGMAMPHNIHHFIPQPGLGGVHQHQHGGHHHSHSQQYHGQ